MPGAERVLRGGWCMYASAKFERLVLGCIKADVGNQIFNCSAFCRDLQHSYVFAQLQTQQLAKARRFFRIVDGIFMYFRDFSLKLKSSMSAHSRNFLE